MREEALISLLSHFTVDERLHLADMDTQMNNTVMRWSDVDSLLVVKGKIMLRSKNTCVLEKTLQAKLEETTAEERDGEGLERVLKQFPNIAKIVVQKKLNENERNLLLNKTELKKMYISSDNFQKGSWDQFNFPNLRSLNILQRLDQPVSFTPLVSHEILTGFPLLRRLCLTGVVLSWSTLKAIFTLPLLQSLDLIGAAVETNQMFYLSALESPKELEEVSLPPSLFSFSTAKINEKCTSNLKWLNAPKVCVYVQRYDKEQFWTDVGRFSSKLEVMVLHGNYSQLRNCETFQRWKKFKFLFGPSSALAMNPSWSGSECMLLSHYVRCPPYAHEGMKEFGDEWKLDIQQTTEPPKELGLKKGRSHSRSRGTGRRRRQSSRNPSSARRRRRRAEREPSPELHTAIEAEAVAAQTPQEPPAPPFEIVGTVAPQRQGDVVAVNAASGQVPQEAAQGPPPAPGQPTDEEVIEALVDLIIGGVARDMERLNAGE